MAMTEATPMMTPSMVRAERTLLRRMAIKAMRRVFADPCSCLRLQRAAGPELPAASPPLVHRRVATTTRPSRNVDRRACAYSAMSCSWVMRMMVMPLLAVEPLQDLHDLDAGAAVEVARWARRRAAISGSLTSGARDGHALLLAARELVRRVVRRARRGPRRRAGSWACSCALARRPARRPL